MSSEGSTTTQVTQSDPIYLRKQVVQNFLLIWLDSDINESDDNCHNIMLQLRSIVYAVNTFTDADQCVDFLTDIKDEKVFMILSATLSEYILPLLHDISQLDVIYIFGDGKSNNEQLATEWSKVKGIHTEIESVYKALKHAIKICDQHFISLSFFSASDDASKKNLNELEPSFMYTQIFKEIFLEMEHNEQFLKDFATYCRDGNYGVKKTIDDFEREYHSHLPVWWYTTTSFLYTMLNRALRTLEAETIIKIGFFVRDLHKNIKQLHSEQFGNHHTGTFTVYRGQGLSKFDFEKLMNSKNGLISFNNFLSTSKNRDVSLLFADCNQYNPDLIGILFKIQIDPSISSIPFAVIDGISQFDQEDETLFSMHTVFRIIEINKIDDNNRLWQVELKLTGDNDEQLRTLTERIRIETQGTTGWQRLGQLLLKIGQFNKADELYRVLLANTSDNNEIAFFYNQLGTVKCRQGEYIEAISFYERSAKIAEQMMDPHQLELACSYNNLGTAYMDMGVYSKALSFYEKAFEIRQKLLSQNDPDIAVPYNNIGSVYERMGDYMKALWFYEKALENNRKLLPLNHPSLATSYNNIGLVYYNMGAYAKALSFYEKSYEIIRKSLPPYHPELAFSCNNIGCTYMNLGNYTEALLFYEKALEISEKILSQNHPNLASLYNNIGSVYDYMGKYSNAVTSHEKALKIQEKVLPADHPLLATTYNNIAGVYMNMKEYSKVLSFYEKALEIRQKSLPPNHPLLASTYSNIGSLYTDTGEYQKALLSHEKSLQIREKMLPPNQSDLAISYNNIGLLYFKMREYSKALSFYEKSLQIRTKILPPNHPDLAVSYNNIGEAYDNVGYYSQALLFYTRSLDILQRVVLSNHPHLLDLRRKIEVVKKKL